MNPHDESPPEPRLLWSIGFFLVGISLFYLSWHCYHDITIQEALQQDVNLVTPLDFFYLFFGKWGVVGFTVSLGILLAGCAFLRSAVETP